MVVVQSNFETALRRPLQNTRNSAMGKCQQLGAPAAHSRAPHNIVGRQTAALQIAAGRRSSSAPGMHGTTRCTGGSAPLR